MRLHRAWGGNVALTLDRLPHCGRIDGLWYATGCNGSGVALNTWLGHRMAAAIDGAPAAPLRRARPPPDPACTGCGARGSRCSRPGSGSRTGEQHEDPRGGQRRRGLGLRHDRPPARVLRAGGARRPRRGARAAPPREAHGRPPVRGRRGRRLRPRPRSPRSPASTAPPTSSTRSTRGSCMPIFDGAFAAGADYLDMAMCLSRPHPERARTSRPASSSATSSSPQADEWEARGPPRPRRHRRRARASPTCSPATPPTTCSAASTSSACATAPTSWSTATTFAPTFSIWTTIEECLNPPVIWERDARLVHDRRRSASRRSSTSPRASARSSASTSSTRRCSSCRAGSTATGSPSSTGSATSSSTCCRSLHKLGLDRTDPVTVRGVECRPRDVVAAVPPRPRRRSATGWRARPARALWVTGTGKDGRRAQRTSTTWPTTRRRCATTAPSASCGRPPSTRSSRSSCSPPARGRARACSARRRSTRSPFLDLLADHGSPWGLEDRTATATRAGPTRARLHRLSASAPGHSNSKFFAASELYSTASAVRPVGDAMSTLKIVDVRGGSRSSGAPHP